MTHRALPLAEVEAHAQAARTAWPMTCDACKVGHPGDCDCQPVIQDRTLEEYDEQFNSADAEVGLLLFKGLCWILAACGCAWLIAGGPGSDAWLMLLDWLESRNG